MEYCVNENDDPVGYAFLTREGLYYRLKCSICPKRNGKYRVVLYTNGDLVDLGLCVPSEQGLELATRVRVKDVNPNGVRFVAMPYCCYPITENGKFPFLYKLRCAYLEKTEIPIAVFSQEAD